MNTQEVIINRIDYIANKMEVMRYYDNQEPKTENAKQKKLDMINNKNNEYIATEKHDGDFGLFAHFSKGNNLIRSRSISKITGVYGDYTAKLPHLCAEMDNWPDGTVVLAELCFSTYNNCNGVGTILRCLPEKAIERQKVNKLYGFIFDVLMYDNKDLITTPYINRLELINDEFKSASCYFRPTDVFFGDFAEHADRIIAAGGEGVVIQRKDNAYMPGTRTAWKTLKLKQSLPEMELKVLDTIEPNKNYEGDMGDSWQFKDANGDLVTKPYFYGWKNGIVVDYNGVRTSVASGLTDEDREWLASSAAAEMIANGELYAVIKGMSTNDNGAIRHPVLVRLRNDL